MAISFAAYRAAVDLFPWDKVQVFDPLMTKLGYNINDLSTSVSTPDGVGNISCAAILKSSHEDGSNQLGSLTSSGIPYADYTAFVPQNSPTTVPLGASYDYGTLSLNHWQPLIYFNGSATITQTFVGAQWQRVTPFALQAVDQYISYAQRFGPAMYGSRAFTEEAKELLDLSSHLTDRQKMVAEYWANGPHSETPAGHWNLIAQFVSLRDHHTLDEDAKMFFALAAALHDAAIACWDAKRTWDSVRPITAIPALFHGTLIEAWGGPYKGTVSMDGGDWLPYQEATFPTPPFPSYFSGHSTFSAAAATVLALWTGSDRFGGKVTFLPGSSLIEPGRTPSSQLTLTWPTFSDASNEAGMSRRYGGIHFRSDDLVGRDIGRHIGWLTWQRAASLFLGSDPDR